MLALVTALLVLPVVQADSIAEAFDDWFRDYRRGIASFDQSVFRPLLRRGNKADGRRLLTVLELPWKRDQKGERQGRLVQDSLLAALHRPTVPLGIQNAFLTRLRAGAKVVSLPSDETAWNHADPALAAQCLPLLGAWHRSRFRPQLERFCRGTDAVLILAAAATLARTGSARSFGVVGRALGRLEQAPHVRRLVGLLEILRETKRVSPGHEAFVLDLTLRRLQDNSVDDRVKEALLLVLREIRDKRAVPVLLGELERVHGKIRGKQATRTGLAFYVYGLHETLQDLTGFWAPASSPDRWWAFWQEEGPKFEVRPKRKATAAGRTVAKFFGIPVRGRRVLFVVDTSGSMKVQLATGRTRLEQAKKELVDAIGGMDPESEFNVILFSDDANRFSRSFARPTERRRKALDRFLGKFGPYGATNLEDALEKGMAGKVRRTQTAQRRSIDEVFVLSDGAPRTDPARILESVGRWNVGRSARIHAVYLGGGDNTLSGLGRIPHGRSLGPVEFMRKLALDNGGVFLSR